MDGRAIWHGGMHISCRPKKTRAFRHRLDNAARRGRGGRIARCFPALTLGMLPALECLYCVIQRCLELALAVERIMSGVPQRPFALPLPPLLLEGNHLPEEEA